MIILAVESSCDETSVAVTESRRVLSNTVATQIAEHKLYGGVVPEIASRRHTEAITEVTRRAMSEAGVSYEDISAVAVTFAPGLIGALLVGVNFAKGLSASLDVPLVPVHHLRSHIAANYIDCDLKPPFLCLTVSGGNTIITEVNDYTSFNPLGGTVDDAAGECFDKVARALGLSYPGGVNLDKIAAAADEKLYPLPVPHTVGKYDFSFSGLKTAAVNLIHNCAQRGEEVNVPVLAGTLRHRVCKILTEKTIAAAKDMNYKTVALAGGVSANSELREMLGAACKENGIRLYMPQLRYCGDNAAMVGVQGYYEYLSGNVSSLDLNAAATMPINYR
ncbi:MAG: tRNA (adenosine(37)-N6)-threonylcarbamoyltransferase complex transferase subunit TsaD [Clostridia bacterium]|nr:tRNA (adenosine(37)-N6)-threonylcarbamoyltransferase complex transferase subunit TsaD [Clostridia bacterium]